MTLDKDQVFSRLDKLSDGINEFKDRVYDDLSEIKVILARNTETVIRHERRSDLQEKQVEMVKQQMEYIKTLQQNCPARMEHTDSKINISKIKDLSVILGVLVTSVTLISVAIKAYAFLVNAAP